MPEFDGSSFRLIVPDSEDLDQLPAEVRRHAAKLPPSTSSHIDLQPSWRGGKEIPLEKISLYWSLIKDHRSEYVIVNDEKSQIITFRNVEKEALNQFCCFVYNKHLTWETKKGKKLKQFRVGDKIMCKKNSDIDFFLAEDLDDYSKQVESVSASVRKYKEDANIEPKIKTERLMNGNLYKIRAIRNKEDTEAGEAEYFELDDLAGNIIRANSNQLVNKTKISHSWALTIHKFQGSESETIVYMLSGSFYESWKYVYTAVTRGRKSVVIVGSYKELKDAVKRKSKTRQTALGEKMRLLMSELGLTKAATEEPSEPLTRNKLGVTLSESLDSDSDDVEWIEDETDSEYGKVSLDTRLYN